MTGSADNSVVRLAAVGDLLLARGFPGSATKRRAAETFAGVRSVLAGCDVVFGNLECSLPAGPQRVPTEPRVISSPGQIRAVRDAGFHVVALGNNHAFDCLEPGFDRMRRLLEETGVACFGAGGDLAEAAAPAVVEVSGIRLGFLGAVDRRCGPYRFAGPDRWGVAPLDGGGLDERIRLLRRQVHHVIVSVHWGEERLGMPSPAQVERARELVRAGAGLVLGHHPHVIQGLERYRGAAIAYSLGNFVSCEVPFSDGDKTVWSRAERTGCILLADVTADGIGNFRQVPTCDTGRGVEIDRSGFGTRQIALANRAVARPVTASRYRREYFRVKTARPAVDHLRWSRLRKLRLRNVRNALAGIRRGLRAD